MTIELITSTSDFIQLKEEWNALLTKSASHVPFLRHEYLYQWWLNLGGEEWDHGELAIIIKRDADQQISGIAPFFIRDKQLLFIGSHEISDYLDLIASPDILNEFIQEIVVFLTSDSAPAWDVIDLYNLPENSPSIALLDQEARSAGFNSDLSILQPSPSITLPSSWQDYLDSLDDRYRQEIVRKIRNAETYFLPVDWYITNQDSDLEHELDDFLELMANNPEKEIFLTDAMKKQLKDSAREAFKEGWLQLAFLTVGNVKAAGYLNFDFAGVIWVYNSGINTIFENLSPGWVLLSKNIQWAIEHGKTAFDFMRGDEAYKYQFGGIDQNVLHLQINKSR